jgi:hypothetical protein
LIQETEPFLEDIESFCSIIRREVTLTLTVEKVEKEPSTATIIGKPVDCNHTGTLMMKKEDQPWITCNQSRACLLKAARITTRRRRK